MVLRGEKLGVQGWRSVGRGGSAYCVVRQGGAEALEVEVRGTSMRVVAGASHRVQVLGRLQVAVGVEARGM